jgi:hypothetical protein
LRAAMMFALSGFFRIDDGLDASGQIPTLSINSAEHRRNRRKQKLNKSSQSKRLFFGSCLSLVNPGTW